MFHARGSGSQVCMKQHHPFPTPRAFKDPLAPNTKCATNPPSKSLQIRSVSCPLSCALIIAIWETTVDTKTLHPRSHSTLQVQTTQERIRCNVCARQHDNHVTTSGPSLCMQGPPLPDMTRLRGQPEPFGFNAEAVCTTSPSACTVPHRVGASVWHVRHHLYSCLNVGLLMSKSRSSYGLLLQCLLTSNLVHVGDHSNTSIIGCIMPLPCQSACTGDGAFDVSSTTALPPPQPGCILVAHLL